MALVPYGNMETSTAHSSETSQVITMKFCTFDYVRETNTCAKFGWNPPAMGRSTHTWNIYFLWLLPFCHPAFHLFFLRTCTGQTNRDNSTHNGSKDAVWRKEVPSQQVFISHLQGSQLSWNSWNFKVVLKLSWNFNVSWNFGLFVKMSWILPLLLHYITLKHF